MIIIEGPDNSGKSTLANEISNFFGLPIYKAGGVPKTKDEAMLRVKEMFRNSEKYIFDRTPLISEPIYSMLRDRGNMFEGEVDLYQKFENMNPIIIYCRPPDNVLLDFSKHEVKDYDSPEHIKAVEANGLKIIQAYDDIMLGLSPIVYDYTKDNLWDLFRMISKRITHRTRTIDNMVNNVSEFQYTILGNEFKERTGFSEKLIDQTLVRLDEELEEFVDAEKLSDQADALVDLIYFALGALYQAGVDTQKVWNAVHYANMTKKKGITKRGDDNDASKPSGWMPPDHTWLDV